MAQEYLGSEPMKLENVEFEISENAENGAKIGDLPYDDMKIASQDGK